MSYIGKTMKLDSYDTPLIDLIKLLKQPADEVVGKPIKEALHEKSELDEEKEIQAVKNKVKSEIKGEISPIR